MGGGSSRVDAAGQIAMMPPPPPIPGVPEGLEYLSQIDQLLIKSKVELFQVLTDIETANQYRVTNTLGQQVFYVGEVTDCCMRIFCGPQRGFELHVVDNAQRLVMVIRRDLKICAGPVCCAGSCDCCTHTLIVEAPQGAVIGYVRQTRTMWTLKFDILDEREKQVLVIQGPICPCGCGDVDFEVMDANETRVLGKVTKQWTGLLKESFTKADNFGVTFPIDLDVKVKATLMGATFLIDFLAFEHKN